MFNIHLIIDEDGIPLASVYGTGQTLKSVFASAKGALLRLLADRARK